MHTAIQANLQQKPQFIIVVAFTSIQKKIMQRKPIIVLVVGILIYLFTRPSDGGVSTITDENVGSSELSSRVTTPVLDDRPRLLYFISINASSIEAKYPHSDDEKDVLDAYASVLLNS